MPSTKLSQLTTVQATGCVEAVFTVKRTDGQTRQHTISFDPGADIDAMMVSIGKNFSDDGDPPFEPECIDRVKAQAQVAWTPQILEAHERRMAALATVLEARMAAKAEAAAKQASGG
jgi:hypothetical protein